MPDWSGKSLAALGILINDVAVQLARTQDELASKSRSPFRRLLGTIRAALGKHSSSDLHPPLARPAVKELVTR